MGRITLGNLLNQMTGFKSAANIPQLNPYSLKYDNYIILFYFSVKERPYIRLAAIRQH